MMFMKVILVLSLASFSLAVPVAQPKGPASAFYLSQYALLQV
jgi:hypothetical protein